MTPTKAVTHTGANCQRNWLRGTNLVRSRTYEMTFVGQAGTVVQAEFDDCEVTVGPNTTTLRAELPDQSALHGLMQRIAGLGLELLDVHVVPPFEALCPVRSRSPRLADRAAGAAGRQVQPARCAGEPALAGSMFQRAGRPGGSATGW